MKLEWTEPSLLDLENIRDYISKDSSYYAVRFISRIIESAESLIDHPLMGRVVPEADDEAVREILFQSYRLIYRVEAGRVLILTVVHGSRDLGRSEQKPWEIV